jgi:hypothetical protein
MSFPTIKHKLAAVAAAIVLVIIVLAVIFFAVGRGTEASEGSGSNTTGGGEAPSSLITVNLKEGGRNKDGYAVFASFLVGERLLETTRLLPGKPYGKKVDGDAVVAFTVSPCGSDCNVLGGETSLSLSPVSVQAGADTVINIVGRCSLTRQDPGIECEQVEVKTAPASPSADEASEPAVTTDEVQDD